MSNRSEQLIRENADKNIGFVVRRISEVGRLVEMANILSREGHSITFFCLENSFSKIIPLFAVEQINHLWAFSGHVFCFDLDLAMYACKCPLRKKIYFLDNLHWTKLGFFLYYNVASVYLHNRLTILSSEGNYEIIKKVWKEPIKFNLSVENIKNICFQKTN